uniref:Uncharacterized protein n=1 Tax=Romanomermis culicivorax TaxID=13658 RepID=A0A915K4N9_ROMCU
MVLEVNSLNIGDFGQLPEWCILPVCHPADDQADSGVVVQTSSFIEKEGQMGGVDGVNDAELLSPQASDPSQD